ncbi:YdcF family protein [Frateuria sp. STR12]|uniref:YdcF family protein n=1 Tax=Frateuria hangzhouensis TaxID=2995589 RepID=UPI002260EBAB|nr:YdcF family protein [Frateuria sp. STR12]MCX7512593.1 YdcF family protein [Frateuria sp. STR12]
MPYPATRNPWRYLRDADVVHAAVVMLFAVLLSAGLVWLGYIAHVWRIARRTPTTRPGRWVVLVFGRQLAGNHPEADYRARLGRALALVRAGQARRLLLLGGHSGGDRSEAQAGLVWLQRHGLPADAPVELEQESTDSLENLRHARGLLQGGDRAELLPPVALLTSRYHLARCLLLARRLGFDAHPLAAEATLPRTPRYLARLLMEATYLMWIDLGVRWARLIGHRRMAARIS